MLVFPDIEQDIVAGLKEQFPMVRIGTKKLPADQQPAVQIVVTATYGSEKSVSPVLRFAGIVLDVYADDYGTANSTALEACGALMLLVGENLKHVKLVSGPTRMGDDTGQEHRAISAEIVVKANDQNI